MDVIHSTEATQDFTNFMEHISRNVKIRDGMIIGSIAELPIEYVVTRMETISVDTYQFSHDECAVLVGDAPPVGFNGTVFTVEPAHDRPGYARLRKPGSSVRYLSIDEMSTYHRSTMKRSNSYKEEILFDAQTMTKTIGKQKVKSDLNFLGMNFTKVNVQGTVTCLSWPREATEWRTRRRAQGWPAQDLLTNIVKAGCHLVPFQGSAKPHDSSVFRLSFARAEVALVYSWNPVQKYVYHILRLIKGDVVKQLELQGHKDIMRSYHFKTLMLWACETKPPEFWDESRVKLSVGELLCEMIEFLVDRNCPNYFMPSVNLMDHLPEDTDVDAVIMPLLVFKEQGAARLIATVPMADPHSRSTIQVSNKLMNLGQIGLTSVHMHAGNRRSVARFCEESSKVDLSYPMEFNSLFDGVSAHLRLASNAGCRQNDYEMAAVNFEQAMLGDIPAGVRRQISLGDALPDVFSSIFFADEKVDPSMRSGDIFSGTRDTTSSKDDTSSCHDTVQTSRLDLRRQEENCTELEAAIDRAVDGPAAKLSSVFHEISELVLDKIEKQGPAEKKPLQSNLQLTLNITTTLIIPAFEYMLPKASSFVSASYRANFFYSHCHDYQLALYLCEESLRRFRSIGMDAAGTYIHDICSVVLTPKWMPIFDQHIQAVYGFVALSNFLKGIAGRRRKSVDRAAECRSTSTSDLCKAATTPHYLSPMEFIDYIKRQCETKLLPWSVNSGSSCSYRLFSHYGTVAKRSRFILDVAFRISSCTDGSFTQNNYCGRSESAWNPYSSRWCK